MVAWVAGATGFVGQAVVKALRAQNIRVIAHVRPDSARLADWRQRFEAEGAEVDVTPWQADALTDTLRRQGVTHVICCVGTTRKRMNQQGEKENSYETVDYGLPKLLATAAHAAGGVQRFVYVSSAGASPRARGAYLQWRWKAEEAVRGSAVPWTIVRPSIIDGERGEERPMERVAARVLDGVLGVVGALGARRLRDRYRSTDDATLARALIRLATDPAAASQTVESENLHD